MTTVHKNQEPLELPYPDGVLHKVRVDLISGQRAGVHCLGASVVEETFTARNAPARECN